jgi:hypothetical protein
LCFSVTTSPSFKHQNWLQIQTKRSKSTLLSIISTLAVSVIACMVMRILFAYFMEGFVCALVTHTAI